MQRKKYFRTSSVGYSQDDWQLLVAIAEMEDRFTKTIATDLMSAAIQREARRLGLIDEPEDENTRDDDYFLSMIDEEQVA